MRVNIPNTPEKNIAAVKLQSAISDLSARDLIDLSDRPYMTEEQKAQVYKEAQRIIEHLTDLIDYNPEKEAV